MRITNSHLVVLGILSTLPLQSLGAPCPSAVKCSESGVSNVVPRLDSAASDLGSLIDVRRELGPRAARGGKKTKATSIPKSTKKPQASKSAPPAASAPAQAARSSSQPTPPGAHATPSRTTNRPPQAVSSTRSTGSAAGTASAHPSTVSSRTSSSRSHSSASSSASVASSIVSTFHSVSTAEEASSTTSTDEINPTKSEKSETPDATTSSSPSQICKRVEGNPDPECSPESPESPESPGTPPDPQLIDDRAQDGALSQASFEHEVTRADIGDKNSISDKYDVKSFLGDEGEDPNESHDVQFFVNYPHMEGDKNHPVWDKWKVTNQLEDLPKYLHKNPTTILSTLVRPETGTIMVLESYGKGQDRLRWEQSTKTPMRWSDMMFHVWKLACGDKTDIKDLKYIVRKNVGDETELYTVLMSILKLEGGNSKKKWDISINRDVEGDTRYFQAIEGTVHGARVDRLLGQHHTDLGDLRIKGFHTYFNPVVQLWDIVIELENF